MALTFLGPLGCVALSVWLDKAGYQGLSTGVSFAGLVVMFGGLGVACWKTDNRPPL